MQKQIKQQEESQSAPLTPEEEYHSFIEDGLIAKIDWNDSLAIKHLTKAIELFPEKPEAYFHRGNVYMLLKQKEKAQQDFAKGLALAKGDKHMKYIFKGSIEELNAQEFYVEEDEEDSDDDEEDEEEEAKKKALNNISKTMNRPNTLHQQYLAKVQQQKAAAAQKAGASQQKPAEEEPKKEAEHTGPNAAYMKALEKALLYYKKALKHNKESGIAFSLCGFLLMELNRVDESIACYQEALKHYKYCDTQIWMNLGSLYEKKKDHKKAIEFYEEAIGSYEDNKQALSKVGHAYVAFNQPDKAIKSFKKLIQLDPANLLDGLCDYADVLYFEKDNSQKALELYREAHKKDPYNGYAYEMIASLAIDRFDDLVNAGGKKNNRENQASKKEKMKKIALEICAVLDQGMLHCLDRADLRGLQKAKNEYLRDFKKYGVYDEALMNPNKDLLTLTENIFKHRVKKNLLNFLEVSKTFAKGGQDDANKKKKKKKISKTKQKKMEKEAQKKMKELDISNKNKEEDSQSDDEGSAQKGCFSAVYGDVLIQFN